MAPPYSLDMTEAVWDHLDREGNKRGVMTSVVYYLCKF